jgi:hypothetical protein
MMAAPVPEIMGQICISQMMELFNSDVLWLHHGKISSTVYMDLLLYNSQPGIKSQINFHKI